jgi:hypothetical protein
VLERQSAGRPARPDHNEDLRYSIDVFDPAGNDLLEVLGRENLLTPAIEAYRGYVKHYRQADHAAADTAGNQAERPGGLEAAVRVSASSPAKC